MYTPSAPVAVRPIKLLRSDRGQQLVIRTSTYLHRAKDLIGGALREPQRIVHVGEVRGRVSLQQIHT